MWSSIKMTFYALLCAITLGTTLIVSSIVIQYCNRLFIQADQTQEYRYKTVIYSLMYNMDEHSKAIPSAEEAANLIALREKQDLGGYRIELIRINSTRVLYWKGKFDETMAEAEAFRQKVLAIQKSGEDITKYSDQISAGKEKYASLLADEQAAIKAYTKAVVDLNHWTIDSAMAENGNYKKLKY